MKPKRCGSSSEYIELIRRNKNFRYLWLGQVISLFGDWFNLIASASLVAIFTKSGLAIGSLFMVRMLAPVFVSPLAGVLVDRFNRKWLLIATDISRMMVVIGFIFIRKPEHIWILYLLTLLQMGISGIFTPARTAILPDLVSDEDLGTANALSSSTWSTMLAVGAAIGGAAAGQWGIYIAFGIDAVTFIFSSLCILQIVYEPSFEFHKKNTSQPFSTLFVEGLRYLRERPNVLIILLLKPFMALAVVGSFQVLQVHIADQIFVIGNGGRTGLGLLYAAIGLGTGIGPIIARKFTGDHNYHMRIAISFSYFLTAIGLLVVASLENFLVVFLGTFLRAVGVGINWVFSSQLLFQHVTKRMHGRIFSTEFALLTLMNAVGSAWGGFGLDNFWLGIRPMLICMS
ncbi:MAG: MFS transporter, partial [Desulfobacteraceae bacterium]